MVFKSVIYIEREDMELLEQSNLTTFYLKQRQFIKLPKIGAYFQNMDKILLVLQIL
jgi:hypothetical protein